MKLPDKRLFYAIGNRDLATARKALERGADVNARHMNGDTALHAASWYGAPDLAQLLLSHGADIEAKDKLDGTPLHEACWSGSLNVVRLLLKKGADVEARDGANHTPLHIACHNGHFDVVEFLLDAGADVNARDNKGQVALDYVLRIPADKSSREKIIDLFRQYTPEQVMEAYCADNASQHIGMGF